MNKKVLVLSNMYPTEKAKSFGIFVKNQVAALRERGLEVDVLAVTNPSMKKIDVMIKYAIWFWQVLVHVFWKGNRYDVVHVHYVFPTGLLGLLYKKVWNTRLIVTAHGGDIERMAHKSERIHRWTMRILQEADHVIAVGPKLAEQIHDQFGVPKQSISIINMGVNRNIFRPMEKEEARKRCGIQESTIPIVYVGNIIEQKGLLELVSAFSLLREDYPNASLYMIGARKDGAFYERLMQTIATHRVDDVYVLDAMNQSELAIWMAAAEVFVLPSHLEGFGLVALEAMSCHTPVVGSDVGGLAYLLRDGAGVLVAPRNVQSLYEGLKRVIGDASLRAELVKHGEQRARENDQQHIIDQIMRLYALPEGEKHA